MIGISRIPVRGAVRALVGPGDVDFFGISMRSGGQRSLLLSGRGRVGDAGPYRFLPLL